MSEPRTLSGRLFQSLGAKYEKVICLPGLKNIRGLNVEQQILFFILKKPSHQGQIYVNN